MWSLCESITTCFELLLSFRTSVIIGLEIFQLAKKTTIAFTLRYLGFKDGEFPKDDALLTNLDERIISSIIEQKSSM